MLTLADIATKCAYGDACESLPRTGVDVVDLLIAGLLIVAAGGLVLAVAALLGADDAE